MIFQESLRSQESVKMYTYLVMKFMKFHNLKDIDNLLKVILDVLPQHFTDENNKPLEGVGLIEKKSDYMIFEINASKKFVRTNDEEGYDIEISEFIENS